MSNYKNYKVIYELYVYNFADKFSINTIIL